MHAIAQAGCAATLLFQAAGDYANPYEEVILDALFTSPEGGTTHVPAFWMGEREWAVRFSAMEPGSYTFTTVCSRTTDTGLHGVSGVVEVKPGTPEGFARRPRVSPDKRSFITEDGGLFFWTGDTWWMGFTSRLDWPDGFKALASDRVAKGFNVIQIVAGPLPDMAEWDPRGANEAGFPFLEGYTSVNPAFFKLADQKIEHLVRSGLTPCIVGMWGYYLPRIGLDHVKQFWRYLIARYAAWPVVWCAAGEGTMPYYLSATPTEDAAAQKTGWTEVIHYIHACDSFGNLVSIHPSATSRDTVEDPAVLDFDMLQTGHGDLDSVAPTASMCLAAYNREPRMPVVNSEVNYEGICGRCFQNVQRMTFCASVFNGVAGYTYGANGVWQLNTEAMPYGPSPHGRTWGNTPWREAMHLPGGGQVARTARFLADLGCAAMENHPEWLSPTPGQSPHDNRAMGQVDGPRVFYFPFVWDPPMLTNINGDGWNAFYYNPSTGESQPPVPVIPDQEGQWRPPLPPEIRDWLLVMSRLPMRRT